MSKGKLSDNGPDFQSIREGTGTRAWSESSLNIGIGCRHLCRYCFAMARALRFGLISSAEDWGVERLKEGALTKRYGKKKGIIMFPTTHDITPFYLDASLKVLQAVLEAGNKVLIVSKPHIGCVEVLCRELSAFKQQVMFRFTIGSTDDATITFWEPFAPSLDERLASLEYAFATGFSTSVSAEPYLDAPESVTALFRSVEALVTDTIWFGFMNKVRERVRIEDKETEGRVRQILAWQTKSCVLTMLHELGGGVDHGSKVRLKESLRTTAGACFKEREEREE